VPSSLIIGALVLAWLVVLVPMVARRRQEVTRTTESALAARVVRSGTVRRVVEEDRGMGETRADDDPQTGTELSVSDDEYGPDAPDGFEQDDVVVEQDYERGEDYAGYEDEAYEEDEYRDGYYGYDYDEYSEYEEDEQLTDELPIPEEEYPYQRGAPSRPYRPGRGGFNPEAAELAKQAKYAFRRRVVLAMVIAAVVSMFAAAVAWPVVWWVHGAVDLSLAGYLVYLRRQVRIEEEVRQRRLARIHGAQEAEQAERVAYRPRVEYDEQPAPEPSRMHPRTPLPAVPGTAIVDVDDDDPAFDELDQPDVLPYRKASGE
jgi:hypothetical protein